MKLRHGLDFLWIPRLTLNKPCLLSKFQFHSLIKIRSCIQKNQLHDTSRVAELSTCSCSCNEMLVQTQLPKMKDFPKVCLDFPQSAKTRHIISDVTTKPESESG